MKKNIKTLYEFFIFKNYYIPLPKNKELLRRKQASL